MPISTPLLNSVPVNDGVLKAVKNHMDLSNERRLEFFMNLICKKWQGFWDYIDTESKYSKEKKNLFLRIILMYADIYDLCKLDSKQSLSRYISEYPDFLLLIPEEKFFPKVIDVINKMNIKFDYLNVIDESTLFDFIYENNYYKINVKMIELILNKKSKLDSNDIGCLKISNYTIIQKSECKFLIHYIEENIESYINDVFLKIESNIKESEESVLSLLGNEKISKETKEKIIEKEKFFISNIAKVNFDFWPIMLKLDKVLVKWNNIIQYYKKFGIDTTLVDFLDRKSVFEKLPKLRPKPALENDPKSLYHFSEELTMTEKLSDSSYEHLINCLACSYNNLAFDTLPASKIAILIKHKTISLTPENFSRLKTIETYSEGKYIDLITENIEQYKNEILSYNLNAVGFEILLKKNILGSEHELKIILYVSEKKISSVTLALIICDIIIKNKYSKISYENLKIIFNYILNDETYINLLINCIDNLSNLEIQELLKIIGKPYSDVLLDSKNINLPKSNTNISFVKKLLEKAYIYKYREENETIIINYEEPLEIIHATYGTTVENQVDVTVNVREHVVENRILIIVNNDIAGGDQYDPVRGELKTLEILYRIGTNEFKISNTEGNEIIIPED
jgi:hypothetical protein